MLAQTGHGGGGIEYNFRAVESQRARAFRKMAVVANLNADASEAQVEDGIAQISWTKVEFFPESGRHVRNMSFAIFTQIVAVITDHGGGVVVDALLLALVDRDDKRDPPLARLLLHEADDGPLGHGFGDIVPAGFLFRAE